jgi:mannose-6-phosphate isomerase-like protein (cupin superfamily)
VLHKRADQLPTFTASDGCRLAEVIHPGKDGTSQGVSLARASLSPGAATTPHRLDFLEIYYVLRGRGVVHHGGEAQEVEPESCVHLPPGAVQWVENTGEEDLVFLCVCHPAWRAGGDHPA